MPLLTLSVQLFPRFAKSGTIVRCPDQIQGHLPSNAAQRVLLVTNGCLNCPVISNNRDIFTDQKDDCCVVYPPPTSAQQQTTLRTMIGIFLLTKKLIVALRIPLQLPPSGRPPSAPWLKNRPGHLPPLPSWDPIRPLGAECPPRRGCIATSSPA